jgi:RNA polymerase sigma-70 factor (ECF subfamily)
MNKNSYTEDQAALVNACMQGDTKAQFRIYQLYYKAMYNVALRMLGESAEAEDVLQESFLSAFEKLHTFKGEVTFGAWLKKIVINRCLDLIKSRRALISLEAAQEISEDSPSEDYLGYKDLDIKDVKNAILELPEGYRVVLSLYLIEGYDHDEISQILQISNATSRTQYHRAKKMLANQLNNLKAVS